MPSKINQPLWDHVLHHPEWDSPDLTVQNLLALISCSKFYYFILVRLELLPCFLLLAQYIYCLSYLERCTQLFHSLFVTCWPVLHIHSSVPQWFVVCAYLSWTPRPCLVTIIYQCADRSEKVIVCHPLSEALAYHSKCAPTTIPHMVSTPERK